MSNANYYASLTPKPPKKRGAWIVILVTTLLVVVPVVIKEIPREQARWYQAAAREHMQRGEYDAALKQLKLALKLDDMLYTSHLLESQIYAERYKAQEGKGQPLDVLRALEAINRASELVPEQRQRLVQVQRADLIHELGLWKEAAAEYKRILQSGSVGILTRVQLLNGSAYNLALAKIDLDTALSDIEEAIDLIPDLRGLDKENLSGFQASCLDTRAYIHYQRGDYRLALKDSEDSISKFEPLRNARIERASAELVRAKELEREKRDVNRIYAVLLYHRLLINDMLAAEEPNRLDLVAEDEALIKELGFKPGPELY